jgi:hypothetical protein
MHWSRSSCAVHRPWCGCRRLATGLGAAALTARDRYATGNSSSNMRVVGAHRGGGTTTGQRAWLGAVTHSGVLTREGVSGDVGELLQHRTWRGGEEHRGS